MSTAQTLADLQYIIDSKFDDKKTELATKNDLLNLKVVLIEKLNDHSSGPLQHLLQLEQ